MSTATILRFPARATETFTLQDALDMLGGAADYWGAHRVECEDCRKTPGGLCRDHDEDDRLGFLAEKIRDALRTAGEPVLAMLLDLGRNGGVA